MVMSLRGEVKREIVREKLKVKNGRKSAGSGNRRQAEKTLDRWEWGSSMGDCVTGAIRL